MRLGGDVRGGVIDMRDFREGRVELAAVHRGGLRACRGVFRTWASTRGSGVCGPLLTALAANPYAFVVGIALMTIALRFVIVSRWPTSTFSWRSWCRFPALWGDRSWVVGVSARTRRSTRGSCYQNPIYLSAYYAVGGEMADHRRDGALLRAVSAICVVGLVASVPCWQWAGIL